LETLSSLDAYLARIEHRGPVSLASMHRAHATSVPFENFESSAGRAVPIGVAELEEKLVARRRGGYCFEQNLLLMAALASRGDVEVAPMLARVGNTLSDERGALNHLVLRVVEHGKEWLADVGFGGGGLLDPIPLRVGAVSDQSGWQYRLVEHGAEIVLQAHQDGAWTDSYGFVPQTAPMIDIEVSNWYTSTHPSSPFVLGVLACARRVDHCLTFYQFSEPTLVERRVGEPAVTSVLSPDEVPALLAQRFGIAGVAVSAEGRVTLGAASS
jgi:N-hydroxyarylamine O-acetyltransferase